MVFLPARTLEGCSGTWSFPEGRWSHWTLQFEIELGGTFPNAFFSDPQSQYASEKEVFLKHKVALFGRLLRAALGTLIGQSHGPASFLRIKLLRGRFYA